MRAVSAPKSRPPASHSHSAGLLQEHEHEPVPGLPEELPAGEHILWQGAPQWRAMATEAFHLRKVAVYFALIGALRLLFLLDEEATAVDLGKGMAPYLVLAVSGLFILCSLAWLSARHTLYTITNRRVVMRIGIVLTVTFNIPFSRLVCAHLKPGATGHGDIALELEQATRIPYLQLWPHARAWHLRQPQPVLRTIADAQTVATLLTHAWSVARGQRPQVVTVPTGQYHGSPSHHGPVHQA